MNSVSGLKVFRLLSLIVLLLAAQPIAYSQETEQTLKDEAAKLFDTEHYVEATSLYLRLLALNPRSTDYNYRYGTCLLYNSYKKQDAFKYLNYAVTDPAIDVQAYYFLGKAYHLNYQFNEAIKNYEFYKQKAGGKPKPSFEIDRQIEMCQNGKRLLTTISDLIVLEKKETETSKFFRLYDLREIGGDILVAVDYQSKVDKKKGHVPLIHLPLNSKVIYYASYGDNDTGQKDIYVRKKLPDGTWSLPQAVQGNVNTKYDEDFPYMTPNGEYLYFSSKGHNSMGGYDVFRAKFDADNNTFGPPENMDFAISSPDNDLFYVVDSLEKNAYFASSRQSSNGNMHVYKVRVERVPLQLAVVKGSFSSTIHPDNKKITINVTDYASGEKIGSFTSNEKGSYLITFPKGGKYSYEMKVDGSTVSHKYIVSIPFLKEFKPLKQKIQEETLDAAEVVKVTDLFNEEVDDPMGVLAEVIKLRSELNPNANQFDLKQLDTGAENQKILAELGFADAGPQEIIATFEQLENRQQEKVQANENLSNGALTAASKKLDEAAKLQEAAKALVNRANSAPTKEQKFELLSQAQEKINTATTMKNDARGLMAFSDSVAKKGTADKELLASVEAVTTEIKKEVSDNNISGLKDIITGNSRTLEAVKNGDKTDPVDALVEQKTKIQKDKTTWSLQRDSYIKTEQTLQQEIKTLEASLATAKKKDQPGIESTISSKKNELGMVTDEKGSLERKILKATQQVDALNERIQFLQGITQVDAAPKVAPAEVQNKFSAVDSKNNNTLAAYINQQVTDMKKDPVIATLASQPEKDPVVETLETAYDDRVASLNNGTFDSPEAKTKQLLQADRDLEAKVDAELEKVEATLQSDPANEPAQERQKALIALKTQTEARIADRETEPVTQQTAPAKITPETELAAIAPDYATALQQVKGLTPVKALEAQNEVDKDLEEKIAAEIAKTDNTLKQNPADAKAKERKTALTALQQQTQERIADRTTEIAALTPPTVITPETELAAIAPDHATALQQAKGSTPAKTLEAQNEVDKDLEEKIAAEIAKTDNQLKQNPADAKAKERKTVLTDLQQQTEERIADRTTEIASLMQTPTATITPETELAAIAPEYDTELAAVKGATPQEILEQQNAIDRTLVAKIAAAMDRVEEQLEQNPDDLKAKERKAALAELKERTEEQMADRETEIATLSGNPSETITPETELATLAPDYVARLEAAEGANPVATLEAKNVVDQQLLDQVNSELEDVEGQLLRNPDNAEATQRQTALNTLKQDAEDRIAERQTAIDEATSEPVANELSMAEISAKVRPQYKENVGKIEATMDDGPEKEQALLKEEQNLLAAINKQLTKKTTEAAKDPGNVDLSKEVTQLREAQAVQEAFVNERELDLTASEQAQIVPERLKSDVMPAFRAPDIENRENYTPAEVARLLEQEQQLQGKLKQRRKTNEKQLAKAFDPKIAAENKVLTALIEQSESRTQALTQPVVEDPAVGEQIAADLGTDAEFLMNSQPETVGDAKRMITELNTYEAQLEEQLNDLESADPADEAAIVQKKQQLTVVRKRIGRIEVELDRIESSSAVAEHPTGTVSQQALTELTAKETELEQRLAAGTLTSAEQRSTEKELAAVRTQKATQETTVLKEGLSTVQTERKAATTELSAEGGNDPVVAAVLQRSTDLTAETPAKSTNRDLAQQVQQEEQAAALLKTTTAYRAAVAPFDEKGLVTATKPELLEQKRRFSVEIGQLESVIEQRKSDPSQTKELAAAQSQQRALEAAVEKIDAMLAQLEAEQVPENPVKKGLETAVPYEQEVELSTSPNYRKLVDQQQEVQATQRQLASVIKEKNNVREQLRTAATSEAKAPLLTQLEDLSAEEMTLRNELQSKQTALDQSIAATSEPEAYRNLLARDVVPVKPAPVAASFVPALSGGFELVATPAATRTEKNIPVDLKLPTGLVYRVQVGAFARPIPEDLFKEFTPVTGEKLTNGITRYLAGYFGNRTKVVDAQRQIRALGYSDAFVVAYCDGNRISLAEARRLEDLGLCIPKNQDSLLLEVAESNLAQLPADSTARMKPAIRPSDYNKAPGAAPAEAAEEHKGLYYTVQVGVYNRPVNAAQVKNINPLITKRLDNGQIRYSSGIFQSIETARPKRAEAIERGITDAFITAYYNGERISLDEAKRLLADQGPSVLEQNTTTVPPNAIEEARRYAATQQVVAIPQEQRVQFVSKERYAAYPRDVISRLNSFGNFYYDAADGHVKLVETVAADGVVLLNGLATELDTVQVATATAVPFERMPSKIVAVWESPGMSGAMADWLLRLTIPHSGSMTEDGFTLSFEGIPTEEQEALIATLESYGASKVQLEEEKRQ